MTLTVRPPLLVPSVATALTRWVTMCENRFGHPPHVLRFFNMMSIYTHLHEAGEPTQMIF